MVSPSAGTIGTGRRCGLEEEEGELREEVWLGGGGGVAWGRRWSLGRGSVITSVY